MSIEIQQQSEDSLSTSLPKAFYSVKSSMEKLSRYIESYSSSGILKILEDSVKSVMSNNKLYENLKLVPTTLGYNLYLETKRTSYYTSISGVNLDSAQIRTDLKKVETNILNNINSGKYNIVAGEEKSLKDIFGTDEPSTQNGFQQEIKNVLAKVLRDKIDYLLSHGIFQHSVQSDAQKKLDEYGATHGELSLTPRAPGSGGKKKRKSNKNKKSHKKRKNTRKH
jgi:hypothetical protein